MSYEGGLINLFHFSVPDVVIDPFARSAVHFQGKGLSGEERFHYDMNEYPVRLVIFVIGLKFFDLEILDKFPGTFDAVEE